MGLDSIHSKILTEPIAEEPEAWNLRATKAVAGYDRVVSRLRA